MSLDPLTAALDLGTTLIDKIFPDPSQKAQASLELLRLQQSGELAAMTAQTDVDKVEAANPSVFVSGWRPAIGWICGAACAWNWVGLPIANFVVLVSGAHIPELHAADITEMLPVLTGMLGIGGLRTIEKINGVARI